MSKQVHAMRGPIRVRLAGPGWLVLGGLAAGAAAKIADESGIGWLADLGTYPAVWVLALAVLSRAAPSAAAAAVTAGMFFSSMVLGYYAWARLALSFPWGPEPLYWLAIATVAVPLLATGVWWALRNTGALAGLVLSAVAAIAVGNGAMLRAFRALTGHLPLDLLRPVQVIAEIVISILLIVVFPRDNRTRWWAIAAWLPLLWFTPRILDPVLARIGLG